jgi:hypothetical protein
MSTILYLTLAKWARSSDLTISQVTLLTRRHIMAGQGISVRKCGLGNEEGTAAIEANVVGGLGRLGHRAHTAAHSHALLPLVLAEVLVPVQALPDPLLSVHDCQPPPGAEAQATAGAEAEAEAGVAAAARVVGIAAIDGPVAGLSHGHGHGQGQDHEAKGSAPIRAVAALGLPAGLLLHQNPSVHMASHRPSCHIMSPSSRQTRKPRRIYHHHHHPCPFLFQCQCRRKQAMVSIRLPRHLLQAILASGRRRRRRRHIIFSPLCRRSPSS